MYGRVLSFLIRHFSNYYTLHRSDLAARAAPLDPRLHQNIKNHDINISQNFFIVSDFLKQKILRKY